MDGSISSEPESASSIRKRRWWIWGIVAIVLLAAIYFGIGAYAADQVTRIDPNHPKGIKTPMTYDVPYETVYFPSRGEDLKIAGWYLPAEGSSRAMILVHGRDASKQDAASGEFVGLGAAINKAGISVLMIDLRGHGQSEGERYTFGYFERYDVMGAVDWLIAQGYQPGHIGVLGLSLGSASAIGAAAEEPAIGLVVIESGFADLYPLIETKFVEESGLPRLFIPGVLLMNRLMFHHTLQTIRPGDELASIAPRPVYIIHCKVDKDVPVSQAEALSAALPYAQTWYVDGCDHAEIYRDYPQEYEACVIPFIDDNLMQ